MIRKLLLATAAYFVGKKLLESRSAPGHSDAKADLSDRALVQSGGGGAGNAFTPAGGEVRPGGEHVPTDLMTDHHPGPDERAVDAFRPDPLAPVPPEEREALRPVTKPVPV